jgi:hypothetical protein
LATIMPPGNTIVVPLDFSTDIDTLISPKYVQIKSPHRIDQNQLQPFQRGLKDVTLIILQNQHAVSATLESIHDTYLVARTKHSTYFRKRGENLLMLIPAAPEKHYILQVTIEEIYDHRLMLRYQDPRYDKRRQIRLASPILLRLLSAKLQTAICQQQTRIMREITLPPEETQPSTPGRLADQLYQMHTLSISSFMQLLQQTPAIPCDLQDISLGGMCLTLSREHEPQAFLQRLIFLHLSFPSLATDSLAHTYFSLHLDLFSTVREVKTTTRPLILYIRFLRRLPEELEPYLANLERCYLKQQIPLG